MQEELTERINKFSREVTENDDLIAEYKEKHDKLMGEKQEIEK